MKINVPITHLSQSLDAICQTISAERYNGKPLIFLSLEQKREAVRLMEQLGALELRDAVNGMARKLGMSRVWVYNCLKT